MRRSQRASYHVCPAICGTFTRHLPGSVASLQRLPRNFKPEYLYNQNLSHHLPRHYKSNVFHGQGPLFPSLAKQQMHTKKVLSHANHTARISVPGFKLQSAEPHLISTEEVRAVRLDIQQSHRILFPYFTLGGCSPFRKAFTMYPVQPQMHCFPVQFISGDWLGV